jgi:hypothetical protein
MLPFSIRYKALKCVRVGCNFDDYVAKCLEPVELKKVQCDSHVSNNCSYFSVEGSMNRTCTSDCCRKHF